MSIVQTALIKNLKKFRRREGLTQEKFAERCNLTTAYIGEIEMGRKFPSHTVMERFSLALHIKPYQLLLEENDVVVFDRGELLTQICERLDNVLPAVIRDAVMKFNSDELLSKLPF